MPQRNTCEPQGAPVARQASSGRRIAACSLLAVLTILAGCGGGGGSGSPPPPAANLPPTAEAGPAQTVDAGALVTLSAEGSRDSDGSISSYRWSQSAGPEVSLLTPDQLQTGFTAPDPAADTELVFSLTVTDDDGATATDSVSVRVTARVVAERVTLGGRILPSASQSVDGDTNDPFNVLLNNNDPANPQPIANPTTLGGYVNEPGAGADGRSQIGGDREDYFAVDLLSGQTVNLLVAEFQDADADLYLYSTSGELLDFSIETGQRETLVIEESGRYLVNVSIFAGATNYTLAIGSSLTPVSAAAYRDVIPGQAVLQFTAEAERQRADETLARELRMRQLGGGERRSRLMALDSAGSNAQIMSRRLGPQYFRRSQFRDPQLAQRWHTLLSIKRMARQPGVASAEPNYRVRPTATVNDEAYFVQWHYPLISLPGAWDTSVGDPGVIVAVVDTGVLSGHPDLAGQLVPGFDFIRDAGEAADGDGIDPNPEESIGGADPAAINFHGTHVTGTIAARGNNRIGVAGAAFGARVMPLRAITASGGTLYDVNQAVRYAAGLANDSGRLPDQPAQIINLSLSGGGFSPSTQNLYNEVHARGISVVAAAGNESSSAATYPASYDNVISVSAVDTQQRITSYSNRGAGIDVAAPGGDGGVDLNGDGYPDGVLSTGASDGEFAYTFLSGTSMASPHVAAVLALMKSVNPQLTATGIQRLLERGELTDELGSAGRDNLYGYGIINARRAVDAAIREAGGSSDSAPRLGVSSSALNFGASRTRLELVLSNIGSGALADISLRSEEPWIAIEEINVDAAGLGRYAVVVDRDRLTPGVYEGNISAASSANSLNVRILLSVTDAADAELGTVYLLLFDPVADEVAAQALISAGSTSLTFEFAEVPAGEYQLFAGTDLDNDLLICDAGEACGAYLTIDQPLTERFDSDRGDLDFPIEYLVALPGTAAAEAGKGAASTYEKLQRKENRP